MMRMRTIAAVRVDCLEESQCCPNIDREDVQIPSEITVEERPSDGSCSEDHDFGGVGVLCGETEGRTVSVMDLVNMPIQRSVMERLVCCIEVQAMAYARAEHRLIPK